MMLSGLISKAQSDVLPINEQGRFIHYERVETKERSGNQLKENLNSFSKNPVKALKLKSNEGDTVFVFLGKFIISKTLLVMSHPSGEILFHLQVELKEGRFRFWLTDFSFVAYQRDRYGNFVPTTNKGIPLESSSGTVNSSQWREYQVQAAEYAVKLAREFKNHMSNAKPISTASKEKIIVKKDW